MDGKTSHELALSADGGQRAKVIEGHRELWDYLGHHPEIPLPNVLAGAHEYLVMLGTDAAMTAEVDRIAAELRVTPDWRDGRYVASRTFGDDASAVYEAAALPRTVPAGIAA